MMKIRLHGFSHGAVNLNKIGYRPGLLTDFLENLLVMLIVARYNQRR